MYSISMLSCQCNLDQSNGFIDPENMELDLKITWLGQIMKELGYFKGFLPILNAILKITPF